MCVCYSLEEDWKLIVTDWERLPERQRQQQNAIWELVYTEVTYLRTLKVITDVSYPPIPRHNSLETVGLKAPRRITHQNVHAVKLG